MSQPTSMRDYYRHIVRDARRGDPTIDEARGDARGLTGWMFEISYEGVPYERVTEQMQLFAAEVMPRLRS